MYQIGPSAAQVDQHTNLLSGRKANGFLDAAPTKENQLRRKSSDKKIFKTPNNLRNSSSQLKSNTQTQKPFGDKQPSPQQTSALGHNNLVSNNPLAGIMPKDQPYFNRKGQNTVVIHVCDE